MTDFLTSLAARTLARPALQPRVLSRFEPDRRGEPLLPAEETEYVRMRAPVTAEPAATAQPESRPRPRQVRDASPAPAALPEPRMRSIGPDETPSPPQRVELREPLLEAPVVQDEPVPPPPARPVAIEPPVRRTPPQRHTVARQSATPAPPSRAIEPPSAPIAPPPTTEVREHTTVVEVPVVQRETIVETHVEDERSRLSAQAGVPVPRERVVAHRGTRSRYEEAPPVVIESPGDPEPPLFREEHLTRTTTMRRMREIRGGPRVSNAAPAAVAPAPEIHVSIGRVEVRATTAPVAEKRRREQPRIMTIDDYVAHRARKERP